MYTISEPVQLITQTKYSNIFYNFCEILDLNFNRYKLVPAQVSTNETELRES